MKDKDKKLSDKESDQLWLEVAEYNLKCELRLMLKLKGYTYVENLITEVCNEGVPEKLDKPPEKV